LGVTVARIMVLPEQVANQIAAGEVIERPASVVKELVENSIDAGSTQIDVRVEEAGLVEIEVRDNGSGIEGDQCLLAFERHATSKIRTSKDLFRIATLGFRGEALASIAAVSKVRMVTATSPEKVGIRLDLEGGDVRERHPIAAPRGTTIQVRDLFFNTPARLKYLKSKQTELAHIHDVMARLALGHPDIAFRFHHQGRLVFSTDGDGRLLHVIHALYGLSVSREMIPIQAETADFEVSGYVGKPQISRANRSHIYWIVNGRAIKNAQLNHALLDAYHTLLMQRRYPIAVIHLRMDPQLVDVNVHPAKLEVRFSKEAELMACIKEAVSAALRQMSLIPHSPVKRPARMNPSSTQLQLELMRPQQVRQTKPPTVSSGEKQVVGTAESKSTAEPDRTAKVGTVLPSNGKSLRADVAKESKVLHLAFDRTDNRDNNSTCAADSPAAAATETEPEKNPIEESGRLPELYPLGQLHGTYILAQNDKGLYLIDQHAAQERIYYEQLAEKAHALDVQRQPLLLPMTIHLHPKEASLLSELWTLRKEEILKTGLELEPFGQHTFLLRAYPDWIPPAEEEYWLQELLQRLLTAANATEPARLSLRDVWDELLKNMACKAAIKANRHLRQEEMVRLLDDLRRTRQPYTCPHGRPVLIHFTVHQIQRMFKRIL